MGRPALGQRVSISVSFAIFCSLIHVALNPNDLTLFIWQGSASSNLSTVKYTSDMRVPENGIAMCGLVPSIATQAGCT